MPRRPQPARLWQRNQTWIVLDRGKQISTGCNVNNREGAEAFLRQYLENQPISVELKTSTNLSIREAVKVYRIEKLQTLVNPRVMEFNLTAILDYWGDKPCSAIRSATCREYRDIRKQPKPDKNGIIRHAGIATVRRELGTLQAAMNYCHKEGYLLNPPKVNLGPPAPIRDRWLTRAEAASVLAVSPPHLRRFILLALYTGSRSTALLRLRWTPSLDSGWVDLERGIIHRKGELETVTNKRRGSVHAPDRLLSHLRRWYKPGDSHVIMYRDAPVTAIRTAFYNACEKAGLADVTPHTLKHTAVTWFFHNGGTIEDAADWFDTTPTTLLKWYRGHSPEYQSRARLVAQARPGLVGTIANGSKKSV